MSIHAMSWVLRNSEATQGRRLVLIALAEFAHDDGSRAFPSVETLMERTRMSRRGVQEALRRLEADEMIAVAGKVSSGTKIYRLRMGGAETAPPVARGADRDVAGAQITTSRGASAAPYPSDPTTDPSERGAAPLEPDEVDRVLEVLDRGCRLKNCKLPARDAIRTVMDAYPDRDAHRVAHELVWWCEHGNGDGAAVKNMASKYRSFMRIADPAPAQSNGGGGKYDRIAN